MSVTQQVGGDHYKSKFQHWDLMEKYDIEYLLATCSKYLVRWQRKGGLEDLKKSLSYVERKLEEADKPRRVLPGVYELNLFCEENSIGRDEKIIMHHLHVTGNLPMAAQLIRDMIEEQENAPRADVNDRIS